MTWPSSSSWPTCTPRASSPTRSSRPRRPRSSGSEIARGRSDGADLYGSLAADYHWLFDAFGLEVGTRTPGVQAAIGRLPAGARILDAACGIGVDAVSLHRRGFRVGATDASPAMVERCRARLAAVGATAVRVTCCAWEDLADHFGPDFDAVLCLGNSLSHAPSPAARRAALTCFAATLVPGGTLILDVQDWTAVHARGSWHDVDPLVVTRDGIRCRRTYDWTVGDRFGDPVSLEITLDLQGPDEEHRASHTMTFLPFTPEQLLADLAAMDFVDLALHQDPGDDRCSVTASFTRRG